jgi:uncharacterized protein (TIGR01732 family)
MEKAKLMQKIGSMELPFTKKDYAVPNHGMMHGMMGHDNMQHSMPYHPMHHGMMYGPNNYMMPMYTPAKPAGYAYDYTGYGYGAALILVLFILLTIITRTDKTDVVDC